MAQVAANSNQPAVSIIGVGNMGGGMASNLLSRGYTVYVHDIDPAKTYFYHQKGAKVQANTAQAAIKSIVTIICVVDALQTHELLFGAQNLAQQLVTGHTVMLCPTMAPADVEQCAAKLAARGVYTIDAPMSGGPARAADGSMSLMVACPNQLFQLHDGLLNDLSSKVFHISEHPGDGARTKLVNNLLAGINLVGAAEVMVLAKRMGLDLNTTLNVIEQSSGQSWIGSDRMRRALVADYEPRAHMGLLAKDTALAIASFQDNPPIQINSPGTIETNIEKNTNLDYTGPLGAIVASVFNQAIKAGLGSQDDAALFKYLQEFR
jgi:L-threonate 2-dehydrogenase